MYLINDILRLWIMSMIPPIVSYSLYHDGVLGCKHNEGVIGVSEYDMSISCKYFLCESLIITQYTVKSLI